jgi:hypothetical protein
VGAVADGIVGVGPDPALGTYPRRRSGGTLIVDAPRGRAVLFGGYANYGPLGDVWTTPLVGPSSWTRLYPAGGHFLRGNHTAVYDSVGQRMIVFGGYDATNTATNETWALTLAGAPTWSLLIPSGTPPVPRSSPGAYDGLRRRLLVFGGLDAPGNPLGDLWALDLAGAGSWSEIVAGGDAPPVGDYSTIVYDAPRDRAVVTETPPSDVRTHVWYLPFAGGTWTHVTPDPDAPSLQYSEPVFDRDANRMLLQDGGTIYSLGLAGTPAWSRLGVSGSTPTLYLSSTAFDPTSHRMLAAAGYELNPLNSLWALDFPPNVFSLDAQALPSFGGAVTVSPALDCFTSGSSVTLTAVPARGFSFMHWSGDASERRTRSRSRWARRRRFARTSCSRRTSVTAGGSSGCRQTRSRSGSRRWCTTPRGTA